MGGLHPPKPSPCSVERKLARVNIFHLHIYLPGFIVLFPITLEFLLIKESAVGGHMEIPRGECHRHENKFRNETKTFQTFG